MMQGQRAGKASKFVRFKVEVSVRVTPWGIYFESNEHFEPGGEDIAALLRIISDSGIESLEYGKVLAEHLLAQQY